MRCHTCPDAACLASTGKGRFLWEKAQPEASLEASDDITLALSAVN